MGYEMKKVKRLADQVDRCYVSRLVAYPGFCHRKWQLMAIGQPSYDVA